MTAKSDLPEDLFFARAKEIEAVLRRAVQYALLMHKRAGNPIASWKDGKVVIIPPEDIPVEDPLDRKSNP
ncbi:MAG TPA: hypothetical protein VJZ26_14810 [Blastocatellia bacterium]|nr:hypothetical protein [Blastocatellia bacterium]